MIAGGIAAIGWIIFVKTHGRSATPLNFGFAVLLTLSFFVDAFLPSGASRSVGYPIIFVAVAMAVGLGIAILHREVRKQKANKSRMANPH
jgi:protein-S-isoprenylcysteine O-methyltransferase Ste14